jgi:hypothetical protein
MIGRHTEVGIVNEDVTGRGVASVLGKQVTGNKLCVPNQICLNRRPFLGQRLLKKIGLVSEDSVSSMMRRGETRLRKAARRWAEAIETIYDLKVKEPERVLVVSFDDLVLDPVNTLESVCAFFDLSFEERMLDGPEHNPYYSEAQLIKEKTRGGQTEKIKLFVEKRVPAAYAKYRRLLGLTDDESVRR